MPNYLIPPIFTSLVSFPTVLYIFFKVPPESIFVKGGFTLLVGLFFLSFLTVFFWFIRYNSKADISGSARFKKKKTGLRKSFQAAVRLTLLPVGYLVLKFSGGYSKLALWLLLGFCVVVNLYPIFRSRRQAGNNK